MTRAEREVQVRELLRHHGRNAWIRESAGGEVAEILLDVEAPAEDLAAFDRAVSLDLLLPATRAAGRRMYRVAPPQVERKLPAIGIAVLRDTRVSVTVPRSDPQSWAIAHRIAAEIAARIATSSGPLATVPIPVLEPGRQGTCVTVIVRCRSAEEAASIAQVAEVAASVGARFVRPDATHRVVRNH